MPENKEKPAPAKSFSTDWLVRGVLTKLGDLFDKLTGRNWKPSSSLATSELVIRLKKLLDDEARPSDTGGVFVPHNIQLKMQWDKFSTDEKDPIQKLETELLVAAIDHINDRRYHTSAPLAVRVKPDYFTDGVKLAASFDDAGAEEREAEINVTVPQIRVGDLVPPPIEPESPPEPEPVFYAAEFMAGGKEKTANLKFTAGKRLSVGRTKENDLTIEDASVSKVHATLMVNAEGVLLVADTGSTNGTFINEERMAYGRAFAVTGGTRVKFGDAEVHFRLIPPAADFSVESGNEIAAPEANGGAGTSASQADFSQTIQDAGNRMPETTVHHKQTAATEVYDRQSFSSEMETTAAERQAENSADQPAPTATGIKLNFTDGNKGN